jgi:hypothetical protein
MDRDPGQIPVPTNGKGPHDGLRAAAAPSDQAGSNGPDQLTVGFTPTQLAVGFGILAALVALVVGRARRRGRAGRGGFGRR